MYTVEQMSAHHPQSAATPLRKSCNLSGVALIRHGSIVKIAKRLYCHSIIWLKVLPTVLGM